MASIDELQKEIDLLKELIALKEKVKEYEIQKIEYVPYYPQPYIPYNPYYPTVPYTPPQIWYGLQGGSTI